MSVAGVLEGEGWSLAVGDCRGWLAGLPAGFEARVVFTDPPYNIGVDYAGDGGASDRLPDAEYLGLVEEVFAGCRRVLRSDGSLWAVINDEYAAEYVLILKRLGFRMRNWVKWYETFGVNQTRKFNRTSRHVLYFAQTKHCYFDPGAVRVPSARQAVYGDRRANPAGKLMDDVWRIPRLVGNAKERLPGFPTQLPGELVRRAVACSSEPGDLVLDPFAGSGTTGAVALGLGRRFAGCELDPDYAARAAGRLATAAGVTA